MTTKQTIKLRPITERPENGKPFYLFDESNGLLFIPWSVDFDDLELDGKEGWLYADSLTFEVNND